MSFCLLFHFDLLPPLGIRTRPRYSPAIRSLSSNAPSAAVGGNPVTGRLCSRYLHAVYPCNRLCQALGFCVVTSVHFRVGSSPATGPSTRSSQLPPRFPSSISIVGLSFIAVCARIHASFASRFFPLTSVRAWNSAVFCVFSFSRSLFKVSSLLRAVFPPMSLRRSGRLGLSPHPYSGSRWSPWRCRRRTESMPPRVSRGPSGASVRKSPHLALFSCTGNSLTACPQLRSAGVVRPRPLEGRTQLHDRCALASGYP